MKKIFKSTVKPGISLLCLIIALLPALSGCQKEKTADVSDILSTVPSSAGMVVGINLNAMLEKAGCKVDGTKITPGKDLENLLSSNKLDQKSFNESVKIILSGESGIDPNGVILFTDAYNTYLTGVLADTEKFCSFVEQQSENKFEDAGDNLKTCEQVAVSGAQFWVSLSNNIDTKAIKNYIAFERSQSFASLPISADIANLTHDVVGYSQIKNLTNSGFSYGNMVYMNVILGIIFDNASALSFNLDFMKGYAEAKALILNNDNQPAKYLLPADKIDLDVVKMLPPTSNAVGAMALPKSLIKKIQKTSESLGGNMLGGLDQALASFDGTTALSMGGIEDFDALSAVITTDGKPSLDLMKMLSMAGSTQKDGKYVKVTKGTVTGTIDIQTAADKLKGATFGVIVNPASENISGQAVGINMTALSLKPDNGSISLNLWLQTVDSNENSLLTLIKKASE